MTSKRVGVVFHVRLTHESIDYHVPLGLILLVSGACVNALARGETEAIVGVVTPTVGVVGAGFGPKDDEQDKGLMPI